jgi:hypothetical protein
MTYSEAASEAERIAFLKLETWLRELAPKLPLSEEEKYVGTGLIAAVHVAMGLPPLLGSCAKAPPKIPSDAEIEAGRLGGKVISLVKR